MAPLTPTPVSIVASLVRLIGLPLLSPHAPALPKGGHVVADKVTLSTETPTATTFWTMASTGLRTLTGLLPSIERSIDPGASANEIGHLAQSVGAAAHQVGTGFVGLLASDDKNARPSPEALEGWRTHAARTLDTADTLLQRAEQSLATTQGLAASGLATSGLAAQGGPETWWAMSELVNARRHVAEAIDHTQAGLASIAPPVQLGALAGLIDQLAVSVLVLLVFIGATLWFGATGAFLATMAAGTWLTWVWRVARPRRKLHLQLNRPDR